eukprot:Tbor_TRINITY_DN6230_c2_g7::TRINITY_DN6230_c2_g7_i1::g.1714::m.1714
MATNHGVTHFAFSDNEYASLQLQAISNDETILHLQHEVTLSESLLQGKIQAFDAQMRHLKDELKKTSVELQELSEYYIDPSPSSVRQKRREVPQREVRELLSSSQEDKMPMYQQKDPIMSNHNTMVPLVRASDYDAAAHELTLKEEILKKFREECLLMAGAVNKCLLAERDGKFTFSRGGATVTEFSISKLLRDALSKHGLAVEENNNIAVATAAFRSSTVSDLSANDILSQLLRGR